MAEPVPAPVPLDFVQGLLGEQGEAVAAQDPNAAEIGQMGTHFTTILNTMYAHIVQLQDQIATAQATAGQVHGLEQQIEALRGQLGRVQAAAAQLNAYRNFYINIFGAFKDIYTVSQKRGEGNAVKTFITGLFTQADQLQINPNAANANANATGRVSRVYPPPQVGGNKNSFSLKRSEKRTESLINKANTLINQLKTKVNKAILLTKKSPLMNKILRTMNSKIKNIPQSKSSKSSSKKTIGGKRKTVKSKAKSIKSKSKSVKRKSKTVKSKK